MTERRNALALAWAGPACIGLVLLGWMVLAGFLPPPSPDLRVDEVAALWREDTDLKRLGMIVCVWGGSLYTVFTIAVYGALRSAASRGLNLAQAACGVFGTVFFSLNFLVLAVVAFRPDRPSEVTQLLHDLGFTMTFSPVAPFTFQYLLVGTIILQNHGPGALFPRWAAYANFWVGVLLIPACAIPFFKTGPMAWNGILSFYIPVFVFSAWFVFMFVFLRRAARSPSVA